MFPDNFIGPGVGMDLALEVYIITLFYVVRVEI
jgi:hypothetical protein